MAGWIVANWISIVLWTAGGLAGLFVLALYIFAIRWASSETAYLQSGLKDYEKRPEYRRHWLTTRWLRLVGGMIAELADNLIGWIRGHNTLAEALRWLIFENASNEAWHIDNQTKTDYQHKENEGRVVQGRWSK